MSGNDLYVPDAVRRWAEERAQARAEKNYEKADALRDRIAAAGYVVKDEAGSFFFERPTIESPDDIPSQMDREASRQWSVVILARDRNEDLLRAAKAVLLYGEAHDAELLVVGNGEEATHDALADLAAEHPPVRAIYTSSNLGESPSLAAALRAATGQYVLVAGVHIEFTGDPFDKLESTLSDQTIGVTGGWGLITRDLYDWESADGPEVDAIEFYTFAFRRELLREVGVPDPRFLFYRNLDLDWCLAFKDKGYRHVLTSGLSAEEHEHIYYRLDPDEVQRLSRVNYGYLLEKWKGRHDLLVSSGGDASS